MAVDVKEYAAFTGITAGYAEEILKDVEHAKWHMPSGAAKLEKAAEIIADMVEEAAAVEPIKVPGIDATDDLGTDDTEDVTKTDPDGGSVEGEE